MVYITRRIRTYSKDDIEVFTSKREAIGYLVDTIDQSNYTSLTLKELRQFIEEKGFYDIFSIEEFEI